MSEEGVAFFPVSRIYISSSILHNARNEVTEQTSASIRIDNRCSNPKTNLIRLTLAASLP